MTEEDRCSAWSVDFLLGLPTGFRAQRPLGERGLWQAEGFLGAELIFPMAGGGFRRRLTPFCGRHDALVVSPGVDAYLLYNVLSKGRGFFSGGPEFAGLVTADVDLSWQHTFGERWGGELGLKVGSGIGYGASWAILPVVSLFAGCRF